MHRVVQSPLGLGLVINGLLELELREGEGRVGLCLNHLHLLGKLSALKVALEFLSGKEMMWHVTSDNNFVCESHFLVKVLQQFLVADLHVIKRLCQQFQFL